MVVLQYTNSSLTTPLHRQPRRPKGERQYSSSCKETILSGGREEEEEEIYPCKHDTNCVLEKKCPPPRLTHYRGTVAP